MTRRLLPVALATLLAWSTWSLGTELARTVRATSERPGPDLPRYPLRRGTRTTDLFVDFLDVARDLPPGTRIAFRAPDLPAAEEELYRWVAYERPDLDVIPGWTGHLGGATHLLVYQQPVARGRAPESPVPGARLLVRHRRGALWALPP